MKKKLLDEGTDRLTNKKKNCLFVKDYGFINEISFLIQIFIIEIIIRFKMGFVEGDSGRLVLDSSRAKKHYSSRQRIFHADGGFALDLFGVIPFHLTLRFLSIFSKYFGKHNIFLQPYIFFIWRHIPYFVF